MRRFCAILATVLIVGVCSLPLLGDPAFQGAAPGEATAVNPFTQVKVDTPRPVLELREKLGKIVNLPKGIDPNTPLKDALEFLSELHDMTILIDQAAFRAEGNAGGDAANIPVALPKMTGVSFRNVLQRLLAGMNPPATFLQRYDHLVVVPRSFACPSGWVRENRHLAPVVDIQFDRRPLEVALREVSDLTGINVVLDARAADKAKTGVTATFAQTAVDTAVYLLADMADLKAVALDNVLYVTSKANADALTVELEKGRLRQRFATGDDPAGGAAK